MSEDKKSIFPRLPESNDQERERIQLLREKIKQNLENEEQKFRNNQTGEWPSCLNCEAINLPDTRFCNVCGSPQNLPFELNRPQPDYEIHTSVYGPPPMIHDSAIHTTPILEPPQMIDKMTYPTPVYGPPPMLGVVTKIFTLGGDPNKDSSPIIYWFLRGLILLGVIFVIGLILYFIFR